MLALGVAVIVAVVVMWGCSDKESPVASTPVSQSGSEISGGSSTTEPPSVNEPSEEEDASNGKVLWAQFATGKAPWLAQFFNDTNNLGHVSYCIYDLSKGFGAQGLPVFEETTPVPSGTNYGDIDRDIYSVIPEDWCGTLDFQADLIRGKVCGEAPGNHGGYNFGAVFGKIERECECQPGEWEEVSRSEKVYGEPGECPDIDASTLCQTPKCYECVEWTQEITESNGCQKRTLIVDGYEKVEVPCPPTPTPE